MSKRVPLNIDIDKLLQHVERDVDTTEYKKKKESVSAYFREYGKNHSAKTCSARSETLRRYRATHQEQLREYRQRPDVKARHAEYCRKWRAKKKAEKEQQVSATQDNV